MNDRTMYRRRATDFLAAFAGAACLWFVTTPAILAQSAIHIVQPGDTLAAVAKEHGTDVAALMRTNSLADANLIRIGQKLALPPGSRVSSLSSAGDSAVPAEVAIPQEPTRVYLVQPDDNLSSIAVKFKTTPAKLAELNQRSPSATPNVGEPLRVPEAGGITFEANRGSEIPAPGSYNIHVLQTGESLAAVAKAYNTSLRRMIQLNKFDNPSNVKPGTRLIVPPPSYAEILEDSPIGPDDYPVYPVVPTQGKWISVDLNHQRAWAWEGNQMIKSFWISSGKSRTPTVTGVFRIWAKIAAQSMEGGSRAAGDYYNLPNVQWVQYFYRDYSFHGTYWHHNFGVPMSHGCVNMSNTDAKWLYDWASPTVTDYKWHMTDSQDPGTLVVIYQ